MSWLYPCLTSALEADGSQIESQVYFSWAVERWEVSHSLSSLLYKVGKVAGPVA